MNFNLTKEQLLLQKAVKDFVCKEIDPFGEQTDRTGRLADEFIRKMADIHLPGMMIPDEYGGNGTSLLDCTLAIEQMGYSGCGAWWYVAFSNSIPDCILRYGSPNQKRRYLPPVCRGESIPSIQFTEDATGSDPQMLQTLALSKQTGYAINGMKRFSTFGARPGFAILFARDETQKCTAFLVDKHTRGYSVSDHYELLGSGGIEAVDVYLDDVILPADSVLGLKGEGFSILLYWIAVEKIQQSASCVGIAQAAMDEAVRYAKQRMLRRRRQADLQGIRFMLAKMHSQLQAARWCTYRSAFLKDTDDGDWVTQAAATKLFVVPSAMKIVEMARRIHGAYGYVKGCKIERLHRAITGASAIAGSLEINQSIVAKSLIGH